VLNDASTAMIKAARSMALPALIPLFLGPPILLLLLLLLVVVAVVPCVAVMIRGGGGSREEEEEWRLIRKSEMLRSNVHRLLPLSTPSQDDEPVSVREEEDGRRIHKSPS